VNYPSGAIQIAFFTQGKTRIAGLFGHIQALGYRGFGIQCHQFLPWPHHLAGEAPTQIQSVEHDRAAESRRAGLLLGCRDQQTQFFFGMHSFGFTYRLDTSLAQQPLSRLVQQPIERIGSHEKPA